MKRCVTVSYCLAGTLLFATAARAEVSAKAQLAPDPIGLDERARLTIHIEGVGFGGLQATPSFDLENLEIESGPHRQSSFRFVNGVASRSLSLRWNLRPLAVGSARVGGIRVQIRNRTLALEDQEISVQSEPVAAQPRARDPFDEMWRQMTGRPGDWFGSRRPAPKVFLRAEVSPAEPYAGQQVAYTLWVYSQANIGAVSAESLPGFDGFWVHEVAQPEQQSSEGVEVDGEPFARVALLRRVLYPLRAKHYEIEPARFALQLRAPERGVFGPLFGSSYKDLTRTSNPLVVNARPLPPAVNHDFSGAVGEVQLDASLEPQELRVGEAATLTLTLSGTAHIQGLPRPALPSLEGLRAYPPHDQSRTEIRATRVHSTRTWSYILIPERTGTWSIDPIELGYFDPASSRYRVAATPTLELGVLEAPPGESREPETAPEPNEPRLPALRFERLRVIALAGLALLAMALAVWLLKRRLDTGANPRREARRMLTQRLRTAHGQTARLAAAEIEDAWRDFLETRWGIGPGSPSNRWPQLLSESGADESAALQLTRLADDLHYLRYAPQLSATDSLRKDLIDRSRRLLKALA